MGCGASASAQAAEPPRLLHEVNAPNKPVVSTAVSEGVPSELAAVETNEHVEVCAPDEATVGAVALEDVPSALAAVENHEHMEVHASDKPADGIVGEEDVPPGLSAIEKNEHVEAAVPELVEQGRELAEMDGEILSSVATEAASSPVSNLPCRQGVQPYDSLRECVHGNAANSRAGLVVDRFTATQKAQVQEMFGDDFGKSGKYLDALSMNADQVMSILSIAKASGMFSGTGALDLEDFLAHMTHSEDLDRQSAIAGDNAEVSLAAFEVFDRNHDGFLCISEMQEVLRAWGEPHDLESTSQRLAAADRDGDGRLSYEEFSTLMRA